MPSSGSEFWILENLRNSDVEWKSYSFYYKLQILQSKKLKSDHMIF